MSATERSMSQRRAKAESVGLQMQDFPLDLKHAIVHVAGETNMNDVAVSVLAERFSIPFEPSGHFSPIEPGESTTFWLKMPSLLRREIKTEAARRDTTAKSVVIDVLRADPAVKKALRELKAK